MSGERRLYMIFKKVKDYIAYGLLTVGLTVLIAASVNATGYQLGAEVIIDHQTIGFVTNREYVYEAIELVRAELEAYNENFSFEKEPVFIGRVVSPDDAMSVGEIRDAIMATLPFIVEGYAVIIDGEPHLALVSEEAANAVIENHKNRYIGFNVADDSVIEFDREVEIVRQNVPVGRLRTPEGALMELSPILNVQHTFVQHYTEYIPYEIERVNDYTMYRGRVAISVQGQRGENAITARVVEVNGVEVSRDVLETTMVRMPSARVERVGQREPPPTIAHGRFIRPAAGTLTSRFGPRWGRMHNGVDIANRVGTPIVAADGGRVIFSGWDGGFGNVVRIDHENGYVTVYAHNTTNLVRVGERVARGQQIATMGSTGNSTGSHIHFEIRRNGTPIDPWPHIR